MYWNHRRRQSFLCIVCKKDNNIFLKPGATIAQGGTSIDNLSKLQLVGTDWVMVLFLVLEKNLPKWLLGIENDLMEYNQSTTSCLFSKFGGWHEWKSSFQNVLENFSVWKWWQYEKALRVNGEDKDQNNAGSCLKWFRLVRGKEAKSGGCNGNTFLITDH